MILRNVKLENIRSYVNEEITLPEGSLLLSGDIGSGKSTILLAIDFALFGIRKSDLTGASLLRNGTDHGSVEMNFIIDGKNVVIKRGLKRTSLGIAQDSGFIMIDGIKKEGTAIELKQSILNLLNYPKELLTKSKSLIYKYTVYTPQEEMKTILTENKESRLDTLRKVFGIDKYKRIKENTKTLSSKIKEKRKEYSGMIFDLEQKKDELSQKKNDIQKEKEKLEEIKPRIEIVRQDLEKKKKEIESTENQINEINKIRQHIEIKNLEIKNKESQIQENLSNVELLKKEIKELEEELKETSPEEDVDTYIKLKQDKVKSLEKETQELLNDITILKTKNEQAKNLKEQIIKIDNCPTCKQEVTDAHKNMIKEEEESKIDAISKKLERLETDYKKKQDELIKDKKDLEEFKEKKSLIDLNMLKKQTLEKKRNRCSELDKNQELLRKEIENLKNNILELETKNKYSKVEEEHAKKKKELEKIREIKSEVEKEEIVASNTIKNMNETISSLKKDIDEKENIKKELIRLTQIQEWLEKYFICLMEVMEKNIMLKVHNDFNGLFQRWFNMIVKEETLQSKLDTSFSPSIEQNGHDIDYNFLSGGEKTAIALAYRLALNQVINKLMRHIKTNDLLILDEPTDGFSNEQLDRVRDVIDELNLKQILVVSHEPKVESFVENSIRFEKENHISRIIKN